MSKDYYKILGVERSSSKDDIKKAFRKLAHKYHPDKKGGDEGKFKEVNEAYSVLSDDKKKGEYDAYGRVFEGGSGSSGQGFSGADFDFSDLFRQGGGQGFSGGINMEDIFENFFGGGGRSQSRSRGRDISIDIQLSFSESVFGVKRKVLINKLSQCSTCQGTKAKPGSKLEKCSSCGGKGKLYETKRSFLGSVTVERVCDSCSGAGELPKEKCENCSGLGVLKKAEEINVDIPSGISDGEMIRLTGMGEASSDGISGDLYVKIHVERHSLFRREGANLIMDLNIKVTDAILGAEYSIDTLDGEIKLKIPQGVSFGEILKIPNKGVVISPNRRGDLLIKLIIKTPSSISKNAKNLLEELQKEGI